MAMPVIELPPKPKSNRLSAVIFSCHNARFYENTVEPHLEKYNLEVVRVIDPSREPRLDVSGVDVAIVLLELMQPSHVARIRQFCRSEGVKCLELHRHITDWDRAFASGNRPSARDRPIPTRQLPPPATKEPPPQWGVEPASRTMPISEPANNTTEEPVAQDAAWNALLEEDNEKLNAKNKELVEKNIALDAKNKELMERVRASETRESKFQAEKTALTQGHAREINEFKELLKLAGEELEKNEKGGTSKFEELFWALHKPWKLGAMTAEEVLEKLEKAKRGT